MREISLGIRILDSGEHVGHPLLSLIRKRSLVRVQAGPPEKPLNLQVKHRSKDKGQEDSRPFLTPTRHQRGGFQESASCIARAV